jgi:hypothetical protein
MKKKTILIETQCEMVHINELQTTKVIKDDITCSTLRILYNCELHDTRMRKKDDIINETKTGVRPYAQYLNHSHHGQS